MNPTNTVGATTVKAYRGDAKTLIAFDVAQGAWANLAGFTVYIKPPTRPGYYLWNDLVFKDPGRHSQVPGEPNNSTANAPIHKFRWVHVPGISHQGLEPEFGRYAYTVTPRYFDDDQTLLALDPAKSVPVEIEVGPFVSGKLSLGFTRGFVQSQAYVHHFGSKIPARPRNGPIDFDTSAAGGRNAAGQAYTLDQQYEWLGFTARDLIFKLLDRVVADPTLTLDVMAYDLSEPGVVARLFKLGRDKRVRVLLDNAALHFDKNGPAAGKRAKPEDEFQARLALAANSPDLCRRGRFDRYAHDKVFIVRRKADGVAIQVLTGSTNFSVTGVYVNSNHILVFDEPGIAGLYAQMFDTVWASSADTAKFLASGLANAVHAIAASADLPPIEITFSPHGKTFALSNLQAMVARIQAEAAGDRNDGSLFFAVMGLSGGVVNPVYDALKDAHTHLNVFSYGVSDEREGMVYYPVGASGGVLATGRPAAARLPKPFSQVPGVGLGHQIHHKFVVCGFNGPNPVVYCGSSNLAYAGEMANGDNLLAIHDADVVGAFVIEALALVDHFNFLGRLAQENHTEVAAAVADRRQAAKDAHWYLGTTDFWARKYFDQADLHCRDRILFAG